MRHALHACLFALVATTGTASAAPPTADEVARASAAALQAAWPDREAPATAVLVARGDEVLFRGAAGSASLELGVPAAPEHVFLLASVTKQFSAAGVLRLAQDGRLSLDDPLSKYLPDYPNGDAITVAMLLNHTSGTRSYTDIPGRMDDGIRDDLDTRALVDSFEHEPAEFAPGTQWRYNNSGYVLAGAVIEQVTAGSWHGWLREAFFAPQAMARTGIGDARAAPVPGLVTAYTRRDGRWVQARAFSMTQPHAAGGLSANVDDLLRWNRALHGGALLDATHYAHMTTPHGAAVAHRYGDGISVDTLRGERMLQHGGGIFGTNTYLLYLPAQQLTVAVLQATDDTGGRPGAETLARQLGAIALGRPYPDKTPVALAPDVLASLPGVYALDDGATRIVRVVDGRLTSQRSGGERLTMIPLADGSFAYERGFTRARFERDVGGRVTGMRVFPEDEGDGEHARRTDAPLPPDRVAIELPDAAVARLVGRYASGAMVMTIARGEDGKPTAQLAGQPAFAIFAESPTKFFLTVVDATLEFTAGDAPPTSVILRQNGGMVVLERQRD